MVALRKCRFALAVCLLFVVASCGSDDSSNRTPVETLEPVPSATSVGPDAVPPAPLGSDVTYATTFDDASAAMFFIGETAFGARASTVDGRYVIEVEDGEWQTITPGPMLHPTDGVIKADIRLEGTGFAGLVARSSVDARGNDWMYSCLFDETGWAGCVASVGTRYEDLFWGAIEGFDSDAFQQLTMSVVGDRVEFVVNDRLIGSIVDSTVRFGAWGVLAESQDEGRTVVSFDNVSISSVSP